MRAKSRLPSWSRRVYPRTLTTATKSQVVLSQQPVQAGLLSRSLWWSNKCATDSRLEPHTFCLKGRLNYQQQGEVRITRVENTGNRFSFYVNVSFAEWPGGNCIFFSSTAQRSLQEKWIITSTQMHTGSFTSCHTVYFILSTLTSNFTISTMTPKWQCDPVRILGQAAMIFKMIKFNILFFPVLDMRFASPP